MSMFTRLIFQKQSKLLHLLYFDYSGEPLGFTGWFNFSHMAEYTPLPRLVDNLKQEVL